MLLAIDAGNTNIVFAVYTGEQWSNQWRFETHPIVPVGQYEKFLRFNFLENELSLSEINHVVISSVVPQMTGLLEDLARRMFGVRPHTIGMDSYQKLDIKLSNPAEIGTDLVANAVAAWDWFKSPCIVVDFGTALTFTSINADAEVIGVAIAPGLKTAVKALSSNTAKLPYVPLELPKSAIGKDTVHAIQSGILLGYTYMVEGMIGRIKSELGGEDVKVVATGGLSSILHTLKDDFDAIDRHLTLEGMRLIYLANK
jgi:type III pantothenate kinase